VRLHLLEDAVLRVIADVTGAQELSGGVVPALGVVRNEPTRLVATIAPAGDRSRVA
jgi:hypothetical protein